MDGLPHLTQMMTYVNECHKKSHSFTLHLVVPVFVGYLEIGFGDSSQSYW
jgi:hypothetical protein